MEAWLAMSDVLTSDARGAPRAQRPAQRPPRPPAPPPRRRSRIFVGVWATLAAAAAGLLLVEAVALSSWIAETRTHAPLSAVLRTGAAFWLLGNGGHPQPPGRPPAPLSAVLRTGAAFWLLGNGGHLPLPAGTAALIPLGLSILFFAFAMRSG